MEDEFVSKEAASSDARVDKEPKKKVSTSTGKKSAIKLSESERTERLNIIKSTMGDAGGAKDDLKLISGVGPKYESTLNEIGIYTFDQVSKMTPEAIKAVEEITNYFPGRIERDDWISQANNLKNK
jgi:molybdopterin-containing oxidoreductase family membrane subunit